MSRRTAADAALIYDFLSVNRETWLTLDQVCRGTHLSRYLLRKASTLLATLAEQDGLCITVANPMDDEKFRLVLTADASNAVNSSLFLGAVEEGVRRRRAPIDEFIVLNAQPGTRAADVAAIVTLEATMRSALQDTVRALRENEIARQRANRNNK